VTRTWGELLGDDPDESEEQRRGVFRRLRGGLGKTRRALVDSIAAIDLVVLDYIVTPDWRADRDHHPCGTGNFLADVAPAKVHVVNHHGSIDPESEVFLATLRSAVMILPSWSPTHPSQDALKRMMASRLHPGPHDIFATLLRPPTRASIGSRADQLKADHGHIVVRVAPGGESYRVYVLDDTTEARTVHGVFGPYATK
jgi:hypothetical protein